MSTPLVSTPNVSRKITEPCRLFVLEHNQLDDFVVFIFSMAWHSDEISQRAAKWLLETGEKLKWEQTEEEKEKKEKRTRTAVNNGRRM